MPDYHAKIIALRAKAADPTVTAAESKTLSDKANELEEKYGKPSSPSTDDTVTTSRDGRPFAWWDGPQGYRATTVPPSKESWEAVWDLFHRQYQWNKPPDEADLVEENYQYDKNEDEDYGYDMQEGEDW